MSEEVRAKRSKVLVKEGFNEEGESNMKRIPALLSKPYKIPKYHHPPPPQPTFW